MAMKDRQRWRSEEDALLRAYVKRYGPREWHLVSQRMNTPLNRDAKSCLERWKNYLKPGIKKGSLTAEEQRLVIRLQAKHGNKWMKIAAEIPGRTAKRLGKWWEVFKEKQQREQKENTSAYPVEEGKYDQILENFAEKLVKEQSTSALLMATSNNGFIHADPPAVAPTMIPPWLSNSSNNTAGLRPPSPSVTLSLSPATVTASQPVPWMQNERGLGNGNAPLSLGGLPPSHGGALAGDNMFMSELMECCRELEEGQRALASHKKEATWRLRRLELQLESQKACKRREKTEEIEAKFNALREEQKACLDQIEVEYREQLAGLRRDAEAKEQKLAEQWTIKHLRLSKLVEQMGCLPRNVREPNGH